MNCTLVLVADTAPGAVVASITALAGAVEVLEGQGAHVTVVVVVTSSDPRVDAFLDTVEGPRVVRRPGAARSRALLAGVEHAEGEVIWIGGTESAPAPSALARLLDAVRQTPGVALAASEDPAPHAALSRDVIPLLGSWRTGTAPEVDPVPDLVRRSAEAGVPVSRVAAAGCLRGRSRTSRDMGASVRVAPGRFSVGPASYTTRSTLIQTYGPLDEIEIGGYCSIADEVRILLPGGRVFDEEGNEIPIVPRGAHQMQTASSFPMGILVPEVPYDEPPAGVVGEKLTIGDDVWVGHGAKILGDVTIGTGAVVGAGALVVKDVPPYAVVAGVPARPLRQRFDDETARRLLATSWWDWPQPVVEGANQWFRRDVADFLRHFDPAGEP